MRDLLDPKYGMFDFFKETGFIWFKNGVFLYCRILFFFYFLSNRKGVYTVIQLQWDEKVSVL